MKPENDSEQAETETVSVAPGTDEPDQSRGRRKGDFGALWLLIVVVAMAGSTIWMIRDVWTSRPVASHAPDKDGPQVQRDMNATATRETTTWQKPVVPAAADTEAGPTELETLRQQKQERLLAIKQEAERAERERLEAAQQLEAERAARAALEQERLDAEKQLEAERQARLALEEDRRRAEQKLARERAAREALEQEARLEQEKLMRAQRQAEQAARERARVEAQLNAAEQQIDATEAEVQSAPVSQSEALVETNDEAVADTPLAESPASIREAEIAGATPPGEAATFSSNPCSGPSARFLSTCR